MTLLILLFLFSCNEDSPVRKTIHGISLFNQESKIALTLPKKLKELSGLALTPDGRLFGHNDESADIFQIDYSNGSIIKSFSVGEKKLKKDFEGIAIVNDLFYLVTSNGEIYEFKEGEDKSTVPYEKYKTTLTSKNNVEGLCYDYMTESLLLACKDYPGKNYNGKRAIYSFSLINKKLKKNPRFLISIEEVKRLMESNVAQKLGDFFLLTEDGFAPSGIEVHPQRKSFFVLSSHGRTIIEINSEGEIMGILLLDKKHHNQPEGITFTRELSLLIGDEGESGKAKITNYPATLNN